MHTPRPEFQYSCGRTSQIWQVSPNAMRARTTDRVSRLARHKTAPAGYLEHRCVWTDCVDFWCCLEGHVVWCMLASFPDFWFPDPSCLTKLGFSQCHDRHWDVLFEILAIIQLLLLSNPFLPPSSPAGHSSSSVVVEAPPSGTQATKP